ncbi:hypothetical protein BALOs_2194 [Halobacteriovorax sp. BALOs_7]|uniref:hypothetical protein n=1 Tax=Halobacteriovorax sp. BALOs_7 TaxID=2109558 RepID=UPI000EA25BAD|nr:hypothetical protein [Halobacteriovorax sp. BALOs_7]AYF45192.1 hypothetical protein BALOs_2194 [Halobacteriovorax sp. BALOs_7]
MRLEGIIIFIALVASIVTRAESIEELCNSLRLEDPSCSTLEIPKSILPKEISENSLRRWHWIIEKVEEKKDLLQAEIDNNKGMLRFLRNDFVEEDESRQWYINEFKDIESDYLKLKEITKQIEIVSDKLNICFRVCSPKMRIENEEHLKKLQKLKILLLSKRPILAGPEIENIIKSKDEGDLKSALVKTYSDYLSGAQDQIREINTRFSPEQRQYDFAINEEVNEELQKERIKVLFDIINGNDVVDDTTSSILSTLDWRKEVMKEPSLACSLYERNKSYLTDQKIKELGLEIGMFVAPFVAGPAFRLSVWGLRGLGLAKWGMREEIYASITKATTGLSSATFFAKDLVAIPKKKEQCESLLNNFIKSKQHTYYQKYTECSEELSQEILLTSVSTALSGLSSLGPIKQAFELSKKYDPNSRLFHVKTMDELSFYLRKKPIDNEVFGDAGYKLSIEKGDYYVLNLNSSNKEVRTMSSNYWNFVSDTYQRRLNLSENEVKDFIQSSRQMEDRTTLIISTEKGAADSMRGGLAFVTSSKADELMPFEKATGVKVDRRPGRKVAEAVRFTVDDKKGDRKLSEELLSQLITSMDADDSLDGIYIFTSKAHERLYERILKKRGINFNRVKDLDRDVVLEIRP